VHPSLFDEVLGEGQAAFVINTGSSDGGTVDFRFQEMNQHGEQLTGDADSPAGSPAAIKSFVDP
jgi:hypothetical protein